LGGKFYKHGPLTSSGGRKTTKNLTQTLVKRVRLGKQRFTAHTRAPHFTGGYKMPLPYYTKEAGATLLICRELPQSLRRDSHTFGDRTHQNLQEQRQKYGAEEKDYYHRDPKEQDSDNTFTHAAKSVLFISHNGCISGEKWAPPRMCEAKFFHTHPLGGLQPNRGCLQAIPHKKFWGENHLQTTGPNGPGYQTISLSDNSYHQQKRGSLTMKTLAKLTIHEETSVCYHRAFKTQHTICWGPQRRAFRNNRPIKRSISSRKNMWRTPTARRQPTPVGQRARRHTCKKKTNRTTTPRDSTRKPKEGRHRTHNETPHKE